jgi:hypothetical protein
MAGRQFVAVSPKRSKDWMELAVLALTQANKDTGAREAYVRIRKFIDDFPLSVRPGFATALSGIRDATQDKDEKKAAITIIGWLATT